MSTRSLRARLARLGPPPKPEGEYCLHHGLHCRMGAEEPLELEVMVYEAHLRCGQPAVSPYEHQLATPAQRARAEAEFAALLEQVREQVRQEEALLRGDQMENEEDLP